MNPYHFLNSRDVLNLQKAGYSECEIHFLDRMGSIKDTFLAAQISYWTTEMPRSTILIASIHLNYNRRDLNYLCAYYLHTDRLIVIASNRDKGFVGHFGCPEWKYSRTKKSMFFTMKDRQTGEEIRYQYHFQMESLRYAKAFSPRNLIDVITEDVVYLEM